MASIPTAGEAQWDRVVGTIEAHWPDGTITRATLQEQNVQHSIAEAQTMGGGAFRIVAGPSMVTYHLHNDQGRQLLAPVIGARGFLAPSQASLDDVTVRCPDDPDWYGVGARVIAPLDGPMTITCAWQRTPEARAREAQAEAQRRAEVEAQAKALVAETPIHSLRWVALHWWYDEWDDGEAVHVECPVCHAFSPRVNQEAGLMTLYTLEELPSVLRCSTCQSQVWMTRELLRETAESAEESEDE